MKRTASSGPFHPTGTCIASTRLMVRCVTTTAGRTARAPISSQRQPVELDAVVEYRNTDGSFGGFCEAHGNWATYPASTLTACSSRTQRHPTMVNPFEQMQNAMGNQNWGRRRRGAVAHYGNFTVSRQHQVIIHEPLVEIPRTTTAGITRRKRRARTSLLGGRQRNGPGQVYTIVQDPWNDNCFWSNAHDKKIGVWNISHTGGFATSGGSATSRLWPKRSRWE